MDHIALRKVEIKDQVIYLNGQKIKFRGVNRHDSDPVTGFTISLEQITTDLTLMKQHNFNAIRSSQPAVQGHFYQNVLQNQRSYVMRILVQRQSVRSKSRIFR